MQSITVIDTWANCFSKMHDLLRADVPYLHGCCARVAIFFTLYNMFDVDRRQRFNLPKDACKNIGKSAGSNSNRVKAGSNSR